MRPNLRKSTLCNFTHYRSQVWFALTISTYFTSKIWISIHMVIFAKILQPHKPLERFEPLDYCEFNFLQHHSSNLTPVLKLGIQSFSWKFCFFFRYPENKLKTWKSSQRLRSIIVIELNANQRMRF